MTRILSAILLLLTLGCTSEGNHHRRQIKHFWIGFETPNHWVPVKGRTAWGFQKNKGYHFEATGHGGVPYESTKSALELLRAQSEMAGNTVLRQSLSDFHQEVQGWMIAIEHQGLEKTERGQLITQLKKEALDTLYAAEKGPESTFKDWKPRLAQWEQTIESVRGDEKTQSLDLLSAAVGYIQFEPHQVAQAEVEVEVEQGRARLYTIVSGDKLKVVMVPVADEWLVLKFWDRGSSYDDIPGFLASLRIGLTKEDLATGPAEKFSHFVSKYGFEVAPEHMAFLALLIFGCIPAMISANLAFNEAESQGSFDEAQEERIRKAVSRTVGWFSGLFILLLLGAAGADIAGSKGPGWAAFFILIGLLIFGAVFYVVAGVLGGLVAAKGAQWGYQKHRARWTTVLGAGAAMLAVPVAMLVLSELEASF